MAQQRLGIIMNGVTGRMGMNQHLIRSILAIRAQGGVALRNGDTVMPDPILVGRNEAKLAQLAKAHGMDVWELFLPESLMPMAAELQAKYGPTHSPRSTARSRTRSEKR